MLPPFNNAGDLPEGIYPADWNEIEMRFGKSSEWQVREGMLPEELMRQFLDTWQTKRDGTKRGIVEIRP